MTKALLPLAFLLVACSHDEATTPPVVAQNAAVVTPAPSPSITPQAAPACPADVVAPKQLVKDEHASSVQLVGSDVYYLTTGGLMKVGVDGKGPVTVVDSAALTHTWVSDENVLTVETSTDTPDAVVRLVPLQDPTNPIELAPPATWNAAGTRIFAADAKSFFLVGDEDTGQAVYQLDVETQAFTQLVPTDTAVITSMQITSNSLWYVRDSTRVFELARGAENILDPAKPTEAFTVDGAGCGLLVDGPRALCIQSSSIQGRDLDGKNPAPLFDLSKSRITTPFSVGVNAGNGIVVAGSNAVRAITNGTEKIIACGRESLSSVDANQTNVVWSESSGVWLAAR